MGKTGEGSEQCLIQKTAVSTEAPETVPATLPVLSNRQAALPMGELENRFHKHLSRGWGYFILLFYFFMLSDPFDVSCKTFSFILKYSHLTML